MCLISFSLLTALWVANVTVSGHVQASNPPGYSCVFKFLWVCTTSGTVNDMIWYDGWERTLSVRRVWKILGAKRDLQSTGAEKKTKRRDDTLENLTGRGLSQPRVGMRGPS